MNKLIKDKWVAALRSGEYTQGYGKLNRQGSEFCCLGVLCDLHSKEFPENVWGKTHNKHCDSLHYMGMTENLPLEVVKWAGIQFDISERAIRIDNSNLRTLSNHNDRHVSFIEIANAIENQL